jgi:hypothetical protein
MRPFKRRNRFKAVKARTRRALHEGLAGGNIRDLKILVRHAADLSSRQETV